MEKMSLVTPLIEQERLTTNNYMDESKLVSTKAYGATSGSASALEKKTEFAYLEKMGVDAGLSFQESGSDILIPLPQWAAFLMWLGWTLKMSASDNRRIFALVVSPVRNNAALLTAFGAQLAGAQNSGGALDWQSLTGLSHGTEIFIQQGKTKNKSGGTQSHGVIEGIRTLPEFGNQKFVEVRERKGTRLLSVDHLRQYTVTLSPLGNKAKTAIHRHGALFKALIPEFDQHWFITPSTECVIAGEVATLLREGESVKAGASSRGPFFCMSSILGIDSAHGTPHAKVALISPRHLTDQPLPSSLCILDGKAAFQSLEHCLTVTGANTIIAVLDRAEFDEQLHQRVLSWIEASRAELLPAYEAMPSVLPPGFECCIAAVPVT